MSRNAGVKRDTHETRIDIQLELDGTGQAEIASGIPFFDHMLTLFSVHGFFDLKVAARGDLEVDFHHTVEDIGLVLGDVLDRALGSRAGIRRYGHAVTPMDETLTAVSVDLSKRPFLVYNLPDGISAGGGFDTLLAKEFFRSLANRGGMNLHINVQYGENEHHILESIFKAMGRAIAQAVTLDPRIQGCRSSKGQL
jgi:imidazoleglycerol-phosphate dehydratase